MNRTIVALSIAVIIILALLAWGMSFTEKQSKVDSVDNNKKKEGRIIVPDKDWKSAKDENGEGSKEEQQSKSGSKDAGSESQVSDSSGVEGAVKVPEEKATLKMQVFIGGKEHPLDEPIYAFEGERVELEVRFTATGSELALYQIEGPENATVASQGKLSGFSASIPYFFTYISRKWEDSGLKIMVGNKEGSAEFRQIMVYPKPLPGTRN